MQSNSNRGRNCCTATQRETRAAWLFLLPSLTGVVLQDPETSMEIKGRNLVDGLPKDILIRSEEVRDAMSECLLRIVEAIKDTLECTPPELSSDIIDRGIMLSGGGALLRGLDTLIQNETGIDVHIAESPLDCVALGAGAVLDNPDLAGRRKEEMSYL